MAGLMIIFKRFMQYLLIVLLHLMIAYLFFHYTLSPYKFRTKISNYEHYSNTIIAVPSIYCSWKNYLGALSLLFECKNELEHCYTK